MIFLLVFVQAQISAKQVAWILSVKYLKIYLMRFLVGTSDLPSPRLRMAIRRLTGLNWAT